MKISKILKLWITWVTLVLTKAWPSRPISFLICIEMTIWPITSLQDKLYDKNENPNYLTKTNRFAKRNCHLRGFQSDFCMHHRNTNEGENNFCSQFLKLIWNVVLLTFLTQIFGTPCDRLLTLKKVTKNTRK